jgi:uncharacterized paraquat-inducible protein A
MSSTPNLTGKSGIQLSKKLSYILNCPKCDGEIDVTDIKTDAHIECSNCKNVTWRPDYNPPLARASCSCYNILAHLLSLKE